MCHMGSRTKISTVVTPVEQLMQATAFLSSQSIFLNMNEPLITAVNRQSQ